MNNIDQILVTENHTLKRALELLDKSGKTILLLVDEKGVLRRTITDGDIRRSVSRQDAIWSLAVESVMTKNPKYIQPDSPAFDALGLMEKNEITVLPIADANRVVCGILHLHDILGKGEFRLN